MNINLEIYEHAGLSRQHLLLYRCSYIYTTYYSLLNEKFLDRTSGPLKSDLDVNVLLAVF